MKKPLKYYYYRFRWWFAGTFHRPGKFPIHVDVELASKCNLHCVFCPHDQGFQNKGLMPITRAKNAIKQAVDGGVMSMKMNFRGEPALNKHLETCVSLANQGNLAEIFMNTNGIPYTEERIKDLKTAGLDKVKISIDGATKATYNKIRKGKDPKRWNKLLQNIQTFQKYGHNVALQMTVNNDNKKEIEKFKERFKGIPITINNERQKLKVRKHCSQPYRRMIVAHDGVVFGCCNNWWDEFPIGNLKEQTLKQIWKGDRMKQLRKHAKEYTGPCENCEIREAWKR